MTEDEATRRLEDALDRLHALATRFDAGDTVDEQSGLTAEDVNLILHVAEQAKGLLEIMGNL